MKNRTKKPKGGSRLAESATDRLLLILSTQESTDFYRFEPGSLEREDFDRLASLHGHVGNTVSCPESIDETIAEWLYPWLESFEPIDLKPSEPLSFDGCVIWIGFAL